MKQIKRKITKTIGTTGLAFSMILAMTCGLAFAQDKSENLELETNSKTANSIGGGLDGTWDVVTVERNCRTNAPIRSHPAVNTYMFGGTMMNIAAGTPPSRRTTGQGVWSHVRGNTYIFSFKAFTFDANNNFTGWVIIRQELNLYGNLYFSSGTGEVYDVNGNLLFTGCSTTTGTQFE